MFNIIETKGNRIIYSILVLVIYFKDVILCRMEYSIRTIVLMAVVYM
jgi:hypothetical protein